MKPAKTLQELIARLTDYWAGRGCVIQLPYDVEMGAGTMSPETFLRVLGPQPYKVAYVQPSRRPADGRYGENPNRLYKHLQWQVILKPSPADIQEIYLKSLEKIGIDLRHHDLKFEEDNWEAPTLGAWGIGWQVMLDGLEVTQFTYFQQCGGHDLEPVSVELTYGLERLSSFLQDTDSVYDMLWNEDTTYGRVRLMEEQQFSVYSFELASIDKLWKLLQLHEQECQGLVDAYRILSHPAMKSRVPVLAAYDEVLKCSHLFNLLDARGAISVTERVAVIGRIRTLACGVAAAYLDQQAQQSEARSQKPEENPANAILATGL
ncbi:MAG: glycine--tRNA ligase subunit alpha [Acidobacteria bacterium]|nr:glycine--tRNA ligase subunit alpha [Acidobacteriota bacterium]